MTNELLVNRYLNYQKREGKSVLTLSAYATDLKQLLAVKMDVKQYRRTLAGYAPNSQARKLTTAREFLKWAKHKGYIGEDFAADISRPKRKTVSSAKPLSASQISRLRRTATAQERLILELLLQTGMRMPEALAIKMKHIRMAEWPNGRMAGKSEIRSPITNYQLPITDHLRQALEYYLAAVTRGPRSYLLVSPKTGRPYSVRMAGMFLSKLGRRAGVRGVTPRNLRATFRSVGRGGLEPPKPSRYKLDALTN